jgi:hypothetical protein
VDTPGGRSRMIFHAAGKALRHLLPICPCEPTLLSLLRSARLHPDDPEGTPRVTPCGLRAGASLWSSHFPSPHRRGAHSVMRGSRWGLHCVLFVTPRHVGRGVRLCGSRLYTVRTFIESIHYE